MIVSSKVKTSFIRFEQIWRNVFSFGKEEGGLRGSDHVATLADQVSNLHSTSLHGYNM